MPEQLPEQKPVFERQKDPNFRSIYANSVQVQTSFFDVKIILSEVQSVENNKIHALDHVAVYMSIEHARSLQHILTAQLNAYEETYGEIRTAPSEQK